jgi:hypothetical protein
MTRAALGRTLPRRGAKTDGPVLGYFTRSELPLASLAFLLPLIVLYELGSRYVVAAGDPQHSEHRIIAFTMMRDFFNLFGATGKYLPAMAVIGILFTWHLARGDSWRIDAPTLLGMSAESIVLAFPLIGIGLAIVRYMPLAGGFWSERATAAIIMSVGAGIYEELVFRLVCFTLLNLLLIDVLGMRRFGGYLLIVLISSLLFAGYHYLGKEVFSWKVFVFRTVAGAYFSLVFAFRGFGITAGTHSAYDVLLVLIRSA